MRFAAVRPHVCATSMFALDILQEFVIRVLHVMLLPSRIVQTLRSIPPRVGECSILIR